MQLEPICISIQVKGLSSFRESENIQRAAREKLSPLACPGRAPWQGFVLLGGGHSDQEYGCS